MISANAGDRISEYVLERPIGRGGFGEVWLARHHEIDGRRVAIKIPVSTAAISELTKEGVIQSSLEHPGIVKCLGMDVTSDPPYFITEYIDGRSLRAVLDEQGRLGAEQARRILVGVLDVLEHAHSRGVVHHDIKPENILIDRDGGVKVADFGLGRVAADESLLLSASLRSESLGYGGTLAYLPPEVRDRDPDIDGRADLFSLGVVMFEILTGQRPAGRELPSDLVEGLPRWCDRAFEGLYAHRDRRFRDVAALRRVWDSRADQERGRARVRVTPLRPPSRSFIEVEQAKSRLGFTDQEFEHWVRCGRLDIVKINGRRQVDEAQIQSFRGSRPRRLPPPCPTRILGSRRNGPRRLRYRGVVSTRPAAPSRAASPPRRSQYSVPRGPAAADLRAAGFWRRSAAMLLDLCLVAALQTFLVVPAAINVGMVGLPFLVACLVYFVICTAAFGQTAGKHIVGVEVVGASGESPTFGEAFGRTIGYVLSAVPFGLGFVVAGLTRERIALHDLISSTRVVHQSRVSARRATENRGRNGDRRSGVAEAVALGAQREKTTRT